MAPAKVSALANLFLNKYTEIAEALLWTDASRVEVA